MKLTWSTRNKTVEADEEMMNPMGTEVPDDEEVCFIQLQQLGSKVRTFESKLQEMRELQDELKQSEEEREELSRKLGEIERKNIRSAEDLQNVLSEKRRIEERNAELQAAMEEAEERIRLLTQEKAEAARENDDLADRLSDLEAANERLREEAASSEEAASADEDFERRYGAELVTDSGRELFMMLRGVLQDDSRDDNGVRMTKSWEEEVEETIPGTCPEEPSITRRVRTRSEVSVEYIAGHKNCL